tara:strand:- start:419 stop:673 length:255 start_codon:yes stop_codon:yes gene_type:complete
MILGIFLLNARRISSAALIKSAVSQITGFVMAMMIAGICQMNPRSSAHRLNLSLNLSQKICARAMNIKFVPLMLTVAQMVSATI